MLTEACKEKTVVSEKLFTTNHIVLNSQDTNVSPLLTTDGSNINYYKTTVGRDDESLYVTPTYTFSKQC